MNGLQLTEEDSTMHTSTSPTFVSRIRDLAHRIAVRMDQSANERLSMQLGNMPVAVLGAA